MTLYQLNGFTVNAEVVAAAGIGIGELTVGAGTDEWSTTTFDIRCYVASLRFGIKYQIGRAVLISSS